MSISSTQRAVDDVSRAVASPALPGIVLAIGHWAKDFGRELAGAGQLVRDLKR